MAAVEGSAAQELGRALREIRASLPSGPGPVVTQADVARRIFVGGKGVISLYESGKRIPTPDVVRRYCGLTGQDPEALMALRDRAVAPPASTTTAPTAPTEPPPLPAPAPPLPTTAPTPTARRRTVLVSACFASLGAFVAAVATRLVVAYDASQDRVLVTAPHGETEAVTTLSGTVEGLASSDLWIDVQALDELEHHLSSRPCDRVAGSFTFDEVQVGTDDDRGRLFRLSVLAVRRGSTANTTLQRYASRRAAKPDRSSGLGHLPVGTDVVTSVVVRRV